MPGMQSYSARPTPWDDREALLHGAVQGAPAKAGDDDKPPIHPLRMRAFFVAAVLTVFTSSLVMSLVFSVLHFKTTKTCVVWDSWLVSGCFGRHPDGY